MSDLDRYLQQHYLSAEQFSTACGISPAALDELIRNGSIPAPSYVVTLNATVRSSPFGEMPAPGSTAGSYFHPLGKAWVTLALEIQSPTELKSRFVRNFGNALRALDAGTWRLPDSFTGSGTEIPDGLSARCEAAWAEFLRGTFGLCVADPSTNYSIANKEILQEKLSTVTNQGADIPDDSSAREDLLRLIDEYATAAMPFSPVEYSRSSRKRLVEDLSQRLANAMDKRQ